MSGHAVTADPPVPARVIRLRPRALGWEVLVVVLGAVAVTSWAFREMLGGLSTTVSHDLGDPLYFAWQLAWVRHALATDPGGLWTTPAFGGAPDNLAFTDTVLGYAPLGLVSGDGMAGGITMLNLATISAGVLAIVGAYALARAMGAGRLASAVAGAGFGFAPWRTEQIIHINVISTGGIALALALLARGTGWSLRRGWEPDRMSWRWILAGWLVACYQLTFGFAIGIWFVHTLGVVMLLWCVGWLVSGRRRARPPRSAVLAHGGGGLLFGVSLLLLLRPYFRVIEAHPEAKRGEEWLPLFAPPWRGLLTAPDTNWFWGSRQLEWRASLTWQPEMVLSPGVVLLVLALVGVFFSVWPWRRRLVLVATVAVLVVLAMGTAFPLGNGEWTYLPLYRHVPGWSALRTTGRLMIWVTLGLTLLAAGAVARLREKLRGLGRVGRVAAVLVAVVPGGLVVVEGLNTTPHWEVSRPPIALAELEQPLLVLPSDTLHDYHMMLWSADGWPELVNGSSGFDPAGQQALRESTHGFPDAASVSVLRERGVETVVVVRSRIGAGSPWAGAGDKPVDGLGITRTDRGDAVVFDLRPGP